MSCQCCSLAREYPGHNQFCPSCLYCGARLIQRIRALPISPKRAQERESVVLRDWMLAGHSERQILTLSAGTTLPLSSEQWPKKSPRR